MTEYYRARKAGRASEVAEHSQDTNALFWKDITIVSYTEVKQRMKHQKLEKYRRNPGFIFFHTFPKVSVLSAAIASSVVSLTCF